MELIAMRDIVSHVDRSARCL